jgi:cytochrome c biogenesis protein
MASSIPVAKTGHFWRAIGDDLWRFFTSVKLAIVLISFGAVIAVVGTLIPQEETTRTVDYISRYGPNGYSWIQRLQLDHIFSSWYFRAALVLFFVNMSCCTVKRLRKSLWYVQAPLGAKPPAAFASLPWHQRIDLSVDTGTIDLQKLKARIEQILHTARYPIKINEDRQLVAEKWRLERFAIDIFHVSLLIILIGALLTSLLGFKTLEVAHKRDIIDVPQGNFSIKVDDFWSNNYPGSERVMDWNTTLTVLQSDHPVLTKTIKVNNPLVYHGIRFYQSAFGLDWLNGAHLTFEVVRASDHASLGSWTADVSQSFLLSAAKIQVKVGAFLPDFALTPPPNQIAYTKTERLDNPAAYLEIYDDQGRYLYRTWVFAQHPELQEMLQQAGVSAPYLFYLKGETAPEFTGIQINSDPGLPVAFGGFIFMMGGLLAHFYFKHKTIWVHIDSEQRSILLGGRVRHGTRSALQEFDQLAARLKEVLNAT